MLANLAFEVGLNELSVVFLLELNFVLKETILVLWLVVEGNNSTCELIKFIHIFFAQRTILLQMNKSESGSS